MAHTPKLITELYAWICTEDDGGEGVPAIRLGDHIMPLMGSDRDRMEKLRPYALEAASQLGRPVRLARFTTMETLEQVAPAAKN